MNSSKVQLIFYVNLLIIYYVKIKIFLFLGINKYISFWWKDNTKIQRTYIEAESEGSIIKKKINNFNKDT